MHARPAPRTRESTTGYVVLGVLATIGAASGYEIRQFIRQSVSYFWNESFGQIYPELKKLGADGLVTAVRERGTDARRRQRFRVTAAGRETLRAWLERPAQPERVRVESLVKLFFGHEVPPAASRAQIAALADRNRERLTMLDRIAGPGVDADAEAPQLVYWLLALRQGQLISRARLRWAGDAERLLDAAHRGGNQAVLSTWRALTRATEQEDE